MSAGPLLPDAPARRRAVTDFDTNLVVLAGAGTGKTSLLVERLLNALGSSTVDVTRFAAITFTDKAAGEMRERLAEGLEELRQMLDGEKTADAATAAGRSFLHLVEERGIAAAEVAARVRAALTRLDRARVTTLHGFCTEVLREYPFEAGVDPTFRVDPGQHYASLLDASWEAFVRAEFGAEGKRSELWRRVLGRFPLGTAGSVARLLAEFRLPLECVEPPYRPADPKRLFRAEALRLHEAGGSILARQNGMSPTALQFFESTGRGLARFAEEGLEALRRLVDRDAELSDRLRKDPPKATKKLQGVDPERMEETASEIHRFLHDLLGIEEACLAELVEALAPFAIAAREALLRAGHVGYDGLLVLARDLLREHPEVREAVRARYRMILVDESQDTDPIQYEIVLFLAEEERGRAGDAYAADLAPGRLFVVGDPKQSIYRFRGADYGEFHRAIERIVRCGGVALDLVGNFRSVPAIVEPINALFEYGVSSTWVESDCQPRYVPILPVRPDAGTEPRVEIWSLEGSAKADNRREAEGLAIAAEIAGLVAKGVCAFEDVFVLMRAFTDLSLYLRPLRKASIPFVVDGGKDFLARPEVAQLMAVLRALAQPADPVAYLAFLRSPAGAVPDTDLAAYASSRGVWSWQERVDSVRFPTLARASSFLQSLAQETNGLPADAVVRRALERSRLLPLGALAFEGAQRIANLRKLATAAAELARDGTLSLTRVLDVLQEDRTSDLEGDSPLAGEGAHAVRVITIHKAKGLENKIVFVPDLARGRRNATHDADEAALADIPGGDPSLGLKTSRGANAAWVWLERERRRHDAAEEIRLLYVALTRAKERLVVLAGESGREAVWVKALRGWGYDPKAPRKDGSRLLGGRVLHRVITARKVEPLMRETPVQDASPALEAYRKSVAALTSAAARPRLSHPSGTTEPRHERLEAGRGTGRNAARAAGTVVHRLLELWDRKDRACLLGWLHRESVAAADELGADPEAVELEAKTVLEAFLDKALASRLATVEVLGREIPMLDHDDEGVTWRGTIDLLYRDADGAIVVADYKTDQEIDDAEVILRHAGQLKSYALAVARALSLPAPPRAELWMLRSGRVLAVPA